MRGFFSGELQVEFLSDGRLMKLKKRYKFTGPDGVQWPVPKGAVTDGASIPRIFWPIVGGPFEGKYRNAAVVHDYYCSQRVRQAQAVHKMFYDAMIASDVKMRDAKILYFAVRLGGPKWDRLTEINSAIAVPREIRPPSDGAYGRQISKLSDAIAILEERDRQATLYKFKSGVDRLTAAGLDDVSLADIDQIADEVQQQPVPKAVYVDILQSQIETIDPLA